MFFGKQCWISCLDVDNDWLVWSSMQVSSVMQLLGRPVEPHAIKFIPKVNFIGFPSKMSVAPIILTCDEVHTYIVILWGRLTYILSHPLGQMHTLTLHITRAHIHTHTHADMQTSPLFVSGLWWQLQAHCPPPHHPHQNGGAPCNWNYIHSQVPWWQGQHMHTYTLSETGVCVYSTYSDHSCSHKPA